MPTDDFPPLMWMPAGNTSMPPAMVPTIVPVDAPTEKDKAAVLEPLAAFNAQQAGSAGMRPVAILLKDASGKSVGGLWGHIAYDWMLIEYLVVPERWRNHRLGTALMQEAERLARAQSCVGIWLDTFSFQARGFYEKLGYSMFGALDDHPVGHQRYFLRKYL